MRITRIPEVNSDLILNLKAALMLSLFFIGHSSQSSRHPRYSCDPWLVLPHPKRMKPIRNKFILLAIVIADHLNRKEMTSK